MKRFFLLFLFFSLHAEEEFYDFEDESHNLFRDLAIVEEVNQRIFDSLPVIYNYQMQGGYFTMPSARMAKEGLLGFGFAYLPPYHLYALSFQLFNRLEVQGNYWVFKGCPEATIGHDGFGDDAERAGNIKYALLRKEDGIPFLPEVALGWNDFVGTKRFRSFYVVATQSFLQYDLELTAGWGSGRIHGFFLGGAWTPFRKHKHFLKGLSLVAEYDANNYKRHHWEHKDGKEVKSRLNAGVHLTLFDSIHLSASTLRGKKFAAQGQLTYNFGETKGIFPKIYDPMPYTNPINTEPLGMVRSQQELAHELLYGFKEQGFDLYTVKILPGKGEKDDLWLKVINVRYREEDVVRKRIEHILAALTPSNIGKIIVVIEADGLNVQEYEFRREDLKRYELGVLSEYEFRIIAPLQEASSSPSPYESHLIYDRKKSVWVYTFRPMFRSYFGSSSGKFKFDVGLITGPEGYIYDQLYYSILSSYTIKSSSQSVGSVDRLNPSQIVNVRSDSILYRQTSSFHVEEAYLQKSWNLGRGCFYRMALGYFEIAYAGIAGQFLYYPVYANWAIGLEAATLLKRSYHGLGFQRKVRKLNGFTPTFVSYYGLQYFLDVYYQYKPLRLDFKFSLGQFLAWDKGIRIEGYRTFPSGMRVGLWITYTNGNDRIGGSRYFDKGFSITFPLDIFMNKSSRTRVGYAMAAWLRDVGAKAYTGKDLYQTIYFERFNSNPGFYD